MTITKKNNKYYCRFQINGERHHYLCSGASSVAEATQMENAFKYKLQQQQNGVIPKEDKRVRLSNILDLFSLFSYSVQKQFEIYCAIFLKEEREFWGIPHLQIGSFFDKILK